MAPLCAQANTAVANKRHKRAALAANPKPIALPNHRDTLKGLLLTITSVHTIEPGNSQKVVWEGSEATTQQSLGRQFAPLNTNIMSERAMKEDFPMNVNEKDWPALPLEEWEATYRTLHMWIQVVGKIRLALTPLQNHFWNVALYVNVRGLTTTPIPYRGRTFAIEF